MNLNGNMPGYKVAESNQKVRDAIRVSLTKKASKYLTICEQLRFIYDTVAKLPEGEVKQDLTEKLIDAFNMGKKMNSRLQRYKREYNDQTGSAGSNLLILEHTEERERLRKNR